MVYLNDNIEEFNFEAALPLLSAQRREQALRFKHEQGRKTCALAYLLLCQGLQKEYGISERPLFEYGQHGKPMLVGRPDIHFSISHCSQAVVCVLSNKPVGADVERIGRYKDSLARYTMNERELQLIGQAERPEVEFTRLWTMKEAVLKRSGRGLTNDLKHVLDGVDNIVTTVCHEKNYVLSVCI